MFNALPVLVAGTGYLNTLNDTDELTGAGVNPTLNVEFARDSDLNGNYSNNYEVQPTLVGIQTINAKWASEETSNLNLADADAALKTVNVNRITANNASITISDIGESVNALSVNDATRYGVLTFAYREDELTGSADALALGLGAARLSYLALQQGTDDRRLSSTAPIVDAGYGFETVNITVSGVSDIDELFIEANALEDAATGDASQAINITANKSLEVNDFDAAGAEEIKITANAAVVIAKDPKEVLKSANDGTATAQLRKLTIEGAGNVTIDGLDGHVDETTADASGEKGTTLTVSAGTMTGALNLGVADSTGSDANVSTTWANRADEDVSITSGSGNDRIEIYGTLAGDITTNAGDDVVSVNTGADDANGTDSKGETYADLEGVSTISTGAGNDKVYAGAMVVTATDLDKTGNGGYDDVNAASILTGEGDDEVTVGAMSSGKDYDNGSLIDSNVDDTYVVKGASVDTGDGADKVTFATMAENATIKTGAGNDTVTADLGATATILAGDTDANLTVKGNTAATTANGTDELALDGSVDLLGAVIELGDGDDTISFTDKASATTDTHTIVGTDAEIRGGAGVNTLNVTALDVVTVAAAVQMADQDPGVTGIQSDVNALIKDIDTINLTVANQVVDDSTGVTTLNETLNGATVNDNVDTGASISLDVRRVDSDLDAINLVSQEQAMLKDPAVENYAAGTTTEFTLDNVREAVKVSLSANEANGVDANSDLKDNTTTDVTLNVSATYAEAVKTNTTFTLDINAAGISDQASYDVDINSFASRDTDPAHDVKASLTDDDSVVIENLVINLKDAASHAFDLGGFNQDADDSDDGTAADTATDSTLLDKATSLKIGTTTDGTKIVVKDASADKIEVLGAADVTLSVTTGNVALDVTTGSGDDVINMINNTVDDDKVATTTYNEQDKINAGDGNDRLVIDGNDSLGIYGAVNTSNNDDDEVFVGLTSIEEIEVRTDGTDSNEIVLDDDAYATGIKSIILKGAAGTNADDQTLELAIGRDFTRDLGVTATGAGNVNLSVDNDGNTNMTITSDALDGATFNFDDAGENNTVNMVLTINDAGGATTISDDEVTPITDGEIDINVTAGSIDKITLVDNNTDVSAVTGVADGKYTLTNDAENGAIKVTISDAWLGSPTKGSVAFTLDASAIDNFDLDTNKDETVSAAESAYTTGASWATGGATIDGRPAGLYTALTLLGTANNDVISGGKGVDTITGNDGNDILQGDNVIEVAQVDTVTFANTYDRGDVIELTVNGELYKATIGTTGQVTGTQLAAAFADILDGTETLTSDNITWTGSSAGAPNPAITATNSGAVLTITGGVVGDRTTISASINNGSDRAQSPEIQTITPVDWETGEVLQLSIGGVTYTQAFNADLATSLADFVTAHKTGIDAASGGALAVGAGSTTLTLTGKADGTSLTKTVDFGSVFSGFTTDGSVALALTSAVQVVSDQAAPTVARVTNVTDGSIYRADTLEGGAGNDDFLIKVSGGGLVANTAATVAGGSGSAATVTFNTTYNADDKVSVVVGSKTYTHTVVAGKTAGSDVATAFATLIDGTNSGDTNAGAGSASGSQLTIAYTAGGDNAFTVTSTVTDAKVVTSSIDTLVGLNLGSSTADVDDIGFGQYLNPGLTTVDAAEAISITQVVNNGAATAMTGASLEAAIDSLFQSNGVFQSSSSSATNAAGLFTYGDDTYLVAVGDTAGVFGNDDFVVKVTGYTGTLSVSDFTIA